MSEASDQLGISQPTISRALQALEKDLGTKLALRNSKGITLTATGLSLQKVAAQMQNCARAATSETNAPVRIAAGGWMSRFLTQNLSAFAPKDSEVTILNSYSTADLANNEAEIALRNKLPRHGFLKVRKIASPAYAVYGHSECGLEPETNLMSAEWIGYTQDQTHFGSQKWLEKSFPSAKLRYRFNQGINILDAIKCGLGIGILPRFVGDAEDGLTRLSNNLDIDGDGLWLLVHEDIRHDKIIKKTIENLDALFIAQSEKLHP